MSLAAITAKARGVALHLGRADTGGYWCGRQMDKKTDASLRTTLHTWTPEEATCKLCLARYQQSKERDLSHLNRMRRVERP